MVEQLGFVQVDSINTVERAHHLILASRLRGYKPQHLALLLERRPRRLFEHWTHDASVIPVRWFRHWHHRFRRHVDRHRVNAWWKERFGGEAEAVIAAVLNRVESEGPLLSRDFEHDRQGEPGGWWGWKPQKAALEYLWRTGQLAIARREGFQKVYDLTHRVFEKAVGEAASDAAEHVDWACSTALERLGVATPTELAAFWRAISIAEARQWCMDKVRAKELVWADLVGEGGGKAVRVVAPGNWRRLAALAQGKVLQGDEARLLCPFDPVVRDRNRVERLFGFNFRFEAFVPAAKRKHGYYVMPILQGERLVGRVDPRFDRARNELVIQRWWLEPGVKANPGRCRAVRKAAAALAASLGAARLMMPARPADV